MRNNLKINLNNYFFRLNEDHLLNAVEQRVRMVLQVSAIQVTKYTGTNCSILQDWKHEMKTESIGAYSNNQPYSQNHHMYLPPGIFEADLSTVSIY